MAKKQSKLALFLQALPVLIAIFKLVQELRSTMGQNKGKKRRK